MFAKSLAGKNMQEFSSLSSSGGLKDPPEAEESSLFMPSLECDQGKTSSTLFAFSHSVISITHSEITLSEGRALADMRKGYNMNLA